MAIAHASSGRMPAAVLAALLLGLLAHPAPDSLALDVVAIDGTPYSDVDLTGCTKAATEESFLAEVAKFSDQDFDAWLGVAGSRPAETEPAAPPEESQAARRQRLATRIFERDYARRLTEAANYAVLGRALDRLVEAHGLVVADYVDTAALERLGNRQAECWEFLRQNRVLEGATADAVYEEARAKYGLAVDRAEFDKTWPEAAKRRLCVRWPVAPGREGRCDPNLIRAATLGAPSMGAL